MQIGTIIMNAIKKIKKINNPEDSIILRKLSEAYNNVYFISNIVLLKSHLIIMS